MSLFIGVDVGTGSARAALVNVGDQVTIRSHCSVPITIWNDRANFYEQSSDNIWTAVCSAVHSVLEQEDIAPSQVAGIGFDATCSLVVLDKDSKPLTVSPSKDDQRLVCEVKCEVKKNLGPIPLFGAMRHTDTISSV